VDAQDGHEAQGFYTFVVKGVTIPAPISRRAVIRRAQAALATFLAPIDLAQVGRDVTLDLSKGPPAKVRCAERSLHRNLNRMTKWRRDRTGLTSTTNAACR